MLGPLLFVVLATPIPFRTRAYEWFLVSHRLAAATFLVGLWFHTRSASRRTRIALYTAIAGPGLSLAWKVGCIVWRGRLLTRWPFAVGHIHAERVFTHLRVSMPPSFTAHPGQYICLKGLSTSWTACFQSHPFMVVLDPIETDEARASKRRPVVLSIDRSSSWGDLLGRRRLFHSSSTPETTREFRVLVDGPYGEGVSLEGFEYILMLAWGSSRMTSFLSYLEMLSERPPRSLRQVIVVWQVYDAREGKAELLKVGRWWESMLIVCSGYRPRPRPAEYCLESAQW